MNEKFEVVISEKLIDKKGVGHIKGTINGKEFHIAGEEGYCDDVKGNLEDDEFDEIFDKLSMEVEQYE